MARHRTAETVNADIVALIWERRKKCYMGGTPAGSCVNQPEWDGIQHQIEILEAEAKRLESAGA